MQVNHYVKGIIAAVAAAAVVAKAAVTDGTLTGAEGVEIALAILAAYGVYRVPNKPKQEDAAA